MCICNMLYIVLHAALSIIEFISMIDLELYHYKLPLSLTLKVTTYKVFTCMTQQLGW